MKHLCLSGTKTLHTLLHRLHPSQPRDSTYFLGQCIVMSVYSTIYLFVSPAEHHLMIQMNQMNIPILLSGNLER